MEGQNRTDPQVVSLHEVTLAKFNFVSEDAWRSICERGPAKIYQIVSKIQQAHSTVPSCRVVKLTLCGYFGDLCSDVDALPPNDV